MKRQLLTLALAGVFGALVAADAKACHKKSCPAPAPCVVVEPCPPPPPVCEPCPPPAPKCGLFKHMGGSGHTKMFGGLCHKKAPVCEPVPTCAPVAYSAAPAPIYAAPQATPQAYASGQ